MSQPPTVRPILIVEEDVALRERLYDLFTTHFIPALTVHSGEHAIKALKHQLPAVVITDAQLPDMTGRELAHQIRLVDASLPIILLGQAKPNGHNAEIQACLPAAAEVTNDALLQEVERWMKAPAPKRQERWPGSILIADDDPRCRFLLQEFLEIRGLTVTTVGSGEEALKTLEQLSPTVVLLDIKMPGMDGLVTLKKIKALRPNASVIMITGLHEEGTIDQALALGALDYITKPFSREYLETTLLSKILLGQTS